MHQDHVEGSLRSAIGQGEKVVGHAMNDPRTTAQGIYDDAAGQAQSALASAGDVMSRSADAVSAFDFSALRDEVATRAGQALRGSSEFHAWGVISICVATARS